MRLTLYSPVVDHRALESVHTLLPGWSLKSELVKALKYGEEEQARALVAQPGLRKARRSIKGLDTAQRFQDTGSGEPGASEATCQKSSS